MGTCEIVQKRLRSLMLEKGMTLHGLAIECGLAPSTVKNIVYGRSKNPGIVTLKILCDGLGVSLIEFFNTPEFRALDQEIK